MSSLTSSFDENSNISTASTRHLNVSFTDRRTVSRTKETESMFLSQTTLKNIHKASARVHQSKSNIKKKQFHEWSNMNHKKFKKKHEFSSEELGKNMPDKKQSNNSQNYNLKSVYINVKNIHD